MADFKVVGSSVPRAEGADKVIGRTLYAADVDFTRDTLGENPAQSLPPRPHSAYEYRKRS